MNYTITPELLSQYNHYLAKSGYSKATYQKYRGDLAQFCEYQKGKTIDEGLCETYRQYLLDHYTLRGACSKIVAVNTFFKFAGWDLQMATPRVDRSRVVDAVKEMTVLEYKRLLRAAKRHDNLRLYYLMQVLAQTKINVSEHRYVTVEAVRDGYIAVPRGNHRKIVVIPDQLRQELGGFAESAKILEGPIFISRSGKCWDRVAIHKSLKKLCREAKVGEEKVSPRSLSHVVAFGSAVYTLEDKFNK